MEIDVGDNEGTVGMLLFKFKDYIHRAFISTTQTTRVAFGTEGQGFGIEGGNNEGTVGYGTSHKSISQTIKADFGTEGQGFWIEGGDNEDIIGYVTSQIQEATASIGLPTVPTIDLVSTIKSDFLIVF